ncbi:MAG: alpha-L-fucosidase, partial [Armatimonadetes bacterium]|nr:alpha-L-fucosidase [Armatimonadota bacterium]
MRRQISGPVLTAAAAVGLWTWVTAAAQENGTPAAAHYLQASPEDMQWWLDAKFGLFIHWGPISLLGQEISWSRHDRADQGHGSVPTEVYDNLYKRFNPVHYDPEDWVRIAKAAGTQYLVFTTRHHDGFCMFDTATTDYKITNSPYGRDITRMLAEACHSAHFRLGFYYSPPDWHHPEYIARNFGAFRSYVHAQLRELMTNYGRVDILWFDGLGMTAEQLDSRELFRMVRAHQAHIIINNRGGLPGDFDTPEQTIGHFRLDRPWESCMTLGTQWSWKPNDRIKSRDECIELLVRCAGGGGNLLLNVGPMPTGEIEPTQAKRLAEIGEWLRRYGESIYGTRGGPFRPTVTYCTTNRGNRVY